MTKYRFEDIAYNSTEKKKPVEKDKYTYIGLEHLEPQCLEVTRYGSEVAPIGEKLIMKKGDVLFGKRRAYQKKVAIAPFDGIFSAHGMVLRPKENVIDPKFFPMFIASDYFLDAAIKISVGSLSPTINWSTLKELEFELPDLNKQHELAELLWAAEETRQKYKNAIIKIKNYLHTRFNELYNSTSFNKNAWPEYVISDIIEAPISGDWGKESKIGNFEVKVLRTTNFTDDGIIDYSDVVVRDINKNKIIEKELRYGDIIIEKSGGSDNKPVGRVVMYDRQDRNYICNNFTSILRRKSTIIDNDFLFLFLFYSYHNGKTKLYDHKTTGIHNLKLQEYLDNTIIKIPSMEVQNQFVNLKKASDGYIKNTKISQNAIENLIKTIINQNLAKEVLHV